MKIYRYILIFLVINFAALALGSYFSVAGPNSSWYKNLVIAPWTPPGWFFGLAWSSIMIFFSVYCARVYQQEERRIFFILFFALQFVLNVSWNPIFFYFHQTGAALFILVCLLLLMILMAMYFSESARFYTWLIIPYITWLFVALSLNAYVSVFNA